MSRKIIDANWRCSICSELYNFRKDAVECKKQGIIVPRYRKRERVKINFGIIGNGNHIYSGIIDDFTHIDEDHGEPSFPDSFPHHCEKYLVTLDKRYNGRKHKEVKVARMLGKIKGHKIISPGESPRVYSWDDYYKKMEELGY